jgi:hypothetical protein
MSHGLSNSSTLALRSGDGEITKMVELMTSFGWPVLPDEGYSIELKSITDDTGNGPNWEISEDCFGSPGLLNHTSYNFKKPSGRDSVFTNNETHLLGFVSSTDFYSDNDNHSLAAISIKEISGPGQFYIGETKVTKGKTYDPSDMVFRPSEPHNNQSRMIYSFIDKSGQESPDHSLWFNPALYNTRSSRANFRHYPVPAREFCVIEIPSEDQGPLDFFLFDINGRILQSLHSTGKVDMLTIDLNGVDDGIYFYLIKTSSSVVNDKIEVIK